MKITVNDVTDFLQHKEEIRDKINKRLSVLGSDTSYQIAATEAVLIKLREESKLSPSTANKYRYFDSCIDENLKMLIIAFLLNSTLLIFLTIQLINNELNEFAIIFIGIATLLLIISILSAEHIHNALKVKRIIKKVKGR